MENGEICLPLIIEASWLSPIVSWDCVLYLVRRRLEEQTAELSGNISPSRQKWWGNEYKLVQI